MGKPLRMYLKHTCTSQGEKGNNPTNNVNHNSNWASLEFGRRFESQNRFCFFCKVFFNLCNGLHGFLQRIHRYEHSLHHAEELVNLNHHPLIMAEGSQ